MLIIGFAFVIAIGGVLFYWGKDRWGSWWVVFVGLLMMAVGLTGTGLETAEAVKADKCRGLQAVTERETRYVKYDGCYIQVGRKFVPVDVWEVSTRGNT